METNCCPRCGSRTVTEGRLKHPNGCMMPSISLRFEPGNMRFFSFRWKRGVSLRRELCGCVSCGLVWSSVAAEELHAYIEKHGNEYAKEDLYRFEKKSPDSELA